MNDSVAQHSGRKQGTVTGSGELHAEITVSGGQRKHEDTSISLYPLTIEEALKKAMDAGPLPKRVP